MSVNIPFLKGKGKAKCINVPFFLSFGVNEVLNGHLPVLTQKIPQSTFRHFEGSKFL